MANIIFWSGIFSPKHSTKGNFVNFSYKAEHIQRPIGPYQLAWWLRKHRFSSQVIEYLQLLTTQELIELTEPFIKSDTLAIGISTVFWPMDGNVPTNILYALNYFRKKYPKLKIIGGGNRSSRKQYRPLNFDKTFTSESENDLLSYLQELKLNFKMPNATFDITQLEHRFVDKDAILEDEVLPIELGRGCIFKCRFCSYINIGKKKHTYQRKFDYIVDEMKYNFDHFKTTKYNFLDDTVNEDYEKIKNLSTLPKQLGFNIKWVGYLRADLLHRYSDSPELLQQSGLLSPYFGLETFNQEAAKNIAKGWNGKKAKDWLPILYNDIWKKEINIFGNFILGLPGESISSWEETLKWCKENLYGHWNFYPLMLGANLEQDHIKSEFDKNYKDYGYEIFADNTWKLGDITFQDAANYASEFNKEFFNTNKVSGFATANALNLEWSLDDIRNVKLAAVVAENHDRIKIFKEKYINKLKDIIKYE